MQLSIYLLMSYPFSLSSLMVSLQSGETDTDNCTFLSLGLMGFLPAPGLLPPLAILFNHYTINESLCLSLGSKVLPIIISLDIQPPISTLADVMPFIGFHNHYLCCEIVGVSAIKCLILNLHSYQLPDILATILAVALLHPQFAITPCIKSCLESPLIFRPLS